jgi:hypothetical protein
MSEYSRLWQLTSDLASPSGSYVFICIESTQSRNEETMSTLIIPGNSLNMRPFQNDEVVIDIVLSVFQI